MKDLTQGSVPRLIIEMAIPIAIGMLVQTLYYLVDLYFVGRLGDTALAGVSASGNVLFLVMSFSQVLNVATAALISQAVGRKDKADANLLFNQSMFLALVLTVSTFILGYTVAHHYLTAITADKATQQAGLSYLYWFLPCMALQFITTVMAAALRGTGIVKPTMVVQLVGLFINIILSPVLIAGWGTGVALGVVGAGLASSIAAVCALLLLIGYFYKKEKYVSYQTQLIKPQPTIIKRLLTIGLPSGGEFFLMFLFTAIVFWTIKPFGAEAQAGFGIGSRLMQSIFLPAMAIAFAVPAVAGQNFGAGEPQRVRSSFNWAAIMNIMLMMLLTLMCQFNPQWFVRPFTQEPDVILVASDFLRILSFNFIPVGIVFICSGMFQSMGNTLPSLLSTGLRLLIFAGPAIWVSQQDFFQLVHIWYLSVFSVFMQMIMSYVFMQREFKRKLAL